MEQLLEWQVVIVGIVAVVVTRLITFYVSKSGKQLSTTVVQWISFGVSFPLALWWGGVQFPALPVLTGDPAVIAGNLLAYLSAWIGLAGGFIGSATVIYHILFKAVIDKLGK